MVQRTAWLEAPESVQAVLRDYDPAKDSFSLSKDSPFWKGVEHAHRLGRRGQGCRVAVIDTGCDLRYPRLQKLVDRDARSMVPGPESEAVILHGTAVALLISEVAPDCRLDVYRVVTDANWADRFAAAAAIRAAAASDADVINLSLGDMKALQPGEGEVVTDIWADPESLKQRFHREEPPCPLCQAAGDAAAAGKLVFASVGNSIAHVYCPARMSGVVAVGFRRPESLDLPRGKRIWFELPSLNETSCADLSLREIPGVLGSSFACPLYAGAAALGVPPQELHQYVSAIQLSAFPTFHHGMVDTGDTWTQGPALVQEIERRYIQAMRKVPHVHCAWQARLRPDLRWSDPAQCAFCGFFAENLYSLFGLWLQQTHRYGAAREILEVARASAPWSAKVWAYLGGVYYALGNLPEGVLHLEQAVRLEPGRAEFESALTTLRVEAAKRDTKRSALEQGLRALEGAERSGDGDRGELCLASLATISWEAGDYERLDYSQQLAEQARRSGSPGVLSEALARVGRVQEKMGDYEAARRSLESAERGIKHLDPDGQVLLNEAMGRVLLRLKDTANGLAFLEAAVDVRRSRGDWRGAAITALNTSRELLEVDDRSPAADWLGRWESECKLAGPEWQSMWQRLWVISGTQV